MKITTAKQSADSRNLPFLKAAVFVIAVMSIMPFPSAAWSIEIPDDGGREQSELMCNIIYAGGQEKESKQEEKAGPATAPKVTFNGPQPYPEQALSKRITGTVKLRLLIKADGSWELDKVLLEEPGDYGFAEAAIKYLDQSSWQPAMKDGKPFDAHFTLTIVFQPPPELPAAKTSQEIESQTAETGPVEITEDMTKPTVTFPPNQPFPRKAKILGQSGMARLGLIIRKDGTCEVVKILAEAPRDMGFAEAALEYIARSNWEPALKDGKPIDVFYEITIQFNLLVGHRPIPQENFRINQRPVRIQAPVKNVTEPGVRFTGPQPYPKKALQERIAGKVRLEIQITADGLCKLEKVVWETPENYGFAEAAVKYLEQAYCQPYIKNGEPSYSYTRITIDFQPPPEPPVDDSLKQDTSRTEESMPVELAEGMTKPELTLPTIQPFPLKAALSGKSGAVKLRLIIRWDGSYEISKVLAEEPTNFGFADAARLYLDESQWKPALKDGEPLDVYYDIFLHFPYLGRYAPDVQKIVGYEGHPSAKGQPPVKIYEHWGGRPLSERDVPNPELIHPVQPNNPEDAYKLRGKKGSVLFECLVNEKGDVIDIKIKGAPPSRYGITEKVLEAVSKWKFKPARYKGKPVSVRMLYDLKYNF